MKIPIETKGLTTNRVIKRRPLVMDALVRQLKIADGMKVSHRKSSSERGRYADEEMVECVSITKDGSKFKLEVRIRGRGDGKKLENRLVVRMRAIHKRRRQKQWWDRDGERSAPACVFKRVSEPRSGFDPQSLADVALDVIDDGLKRKVDDDHIADMEQVAKESTEGLNLCFPSNITARVLARAYPANHPFTIELRDLDAMQLGMVLTLFEAFRDAAMRAAKVVEEQGVDEGAAQAN